MLEPLPQELPVPPDLEFGPEVEYYEDYVEPGSVDTAEPSNLVYLDDYRAVKRARESDSDFAALVRDNYDLLKLIPSAYFIAGGDINDLEQEALIGFYKAVRDYDGESSSLRSFASLCIRRQVITAVKTASRFKHGPLNDARSFAEPDPEHEDVFMFDNLPDQSPSTLDDLESKDGIANILEIVKTMLSDLESEALKRFINGDSYEAIANKLEVSTKTVDNALQRAKRKIIAFKDADLVTIQSGRSENGDGKLPRDLRYKLVLSPADKFSNAEARTLLAEIYADEVSEIKDEELYSLFSALPGMLWRRASDFEDLELYLLTQHDILMGKTAAEAAAGISMSRSRFVKWRAERSQIAAGLISLENLRSVARARKRINERVVRRSEAFVIDSTIT